MEWVAISFSNAWKWKVKVKSLSRVWLLMTPWTAAHQAPPSVGFSRQEYWSGVPLPSPRKNEETEPKQKQHPVVNVTGDGSKVQCCKEPYCIGTWNIRSMNQDKLEEVKQEMIRVNIDAVGISELKWSGTGEFNSDDHYIYCCGQESLRRNGVAIIVNKRVQNAVLGCNLKNNRKISVRFHSRQTIQYHGNPSLCSDQ